MELDGVAVYGIVGHRSQISACLCIGRRSRDSAFELPFKFN